jgi:hypothetical protein
VSDGGVVVSQLGILIAFSLSPKRYTCKEGD